VTRRISTMER